MNDEPNLSLIVKTSLSLDNIKLLETSALDKKQRNARAARSGVNDPRNSNLRESVVTGVGGRTGIDQSSQNYLNNFDGAIEIN